MSPSSYLQQIKWQVEPTCPWPRAGDGGGGGGGGGGAALKTGEGSSYAGALISTGAQFPHRLLHLRTRHLQQCI